MIDYATTPKIKICGICSVEDAQLAIKYEVEYIGLIFVKSSPRYVEPVIAKSIANTVGDKIQVVGVFQNSTLQEMENISSLVGLNYFQLHGHESPNLCGSLSKPVIKVFQIAHELTYEEPCVSVPLLKSEAKQEIENYPSILEKYGPYCQHFLFDKPKKFTKDNKHNWLDLASQRLRPMEEYLHSYIFGGGLNSGNVQKVLRELKPSILDIASGVEKTVRTKSETLIEEFCSNARTLSNEAFISRLKGN